MNSESQHRTRGSDRARVTQGIDHRPILIVPYTWIGDFVRCQTVAKLLRARFPGRPVDVVASRLCAPLADYMPECARRCRDLSPKRLVRSEYGRCRTPPGRRLRQRADHVAEVEGGARAVPRRHPGTYRLRGRVRFGLLTTCGSANASGAHGRPLRALALPRGARCRRTCPARTPRAGGRVDAWREQRARARRTARGRARARRRGPSKRWPATRACAPVAEQGAHVWVLGGPDEKGVAAEIAGTAARASAT